MRMAAFLMAALPLASGMACAAPGDRVTVLESGDSASLTAVREAWQPVERNTPAMELGVLPALDIPASTTPPALKLVCNFKTNEAWRVAWDKFCPSGKWDLSGCQTLRLDLAADGDQNSSPAYMIIYLHSEQGWYGCHFTAMPGRNTVLVPQKGFTTEDKPGGWDRIDRIRLSVIRDEAKNRVVLLGRIEAVARPASVVVYRNDAGMKSEPGIPQYVRLMGDALDRLGIVYEIIGDEEVAAGRLAGKKVSILPLNPVMPAKASVALEKFVADGGKLIVCYCLPDPLDRLLGVQTGRTLQDADKLHAFTFKPASGSGPEPPSAITVIQDSWIAHGVTARPQAEVRAFWIGKDDKESNQPAVTCNAAGIFIGHVLTPFDETRKDLLVQEMIGELWPGMWEAVYKARLEAFGRMAGFKDATEVVKAIAINQKGGRVSQPSDWDTLRTAATATAAGGNFAKASALMSRAQDGLLRDYAASVPPKAHEFRAVWCHNPAGVTGMTWEGAIKRLADAGFNAIIPNMCWGDSAAYESTVLPKAPGMKGDQLAECLAAARRHGVAVHVWRVNWNLFGRTDDKAKAELGQAGRLQMDASGKPVDWLCPSHPDNQKLELDAMLEIARKYDVAGLHFDYIRYPGEKACFCSGCRQRFEAREGITARNWPGDVIDGPLRQKYLQFRRDNITRLVAAVSDQARKVRPGIKISAAVFPHWTSARNDVGQDWKLWAEKGYLDFVCPMQYTDNALLFESQTRQSAGWIAGRIPLVPGIGATLGNPSDGTLQQVLLARRQGASGFVLFNYGPALLEHLKLLGLGATRPEGRK